MGLIALFESQATGYTNSSQADACSLRRHPMLQPWPNNPPVADSKLFTGVVNALLIEAAAVALIVLLYWLF
jgi:hypothetical protein